MKYKTSLAFVISLALLTSCNDTADQNDNKAEVSQSEIVEDATEKTVETVEDIKAESKESKEEEKKSESKEEGEKLSKEELFSKLNELPSLESYKIETTAEKIAKANSDNPEIINSTDAKLEYIKEPHIYHALYEIHDPAVGEMETETYQNGKVAVTRQDASGWMKTEIPENEANDENNIIVSELDDYYTVSETDDYYLIEIETTPDNLEEIKDLIMGDEFEQIFDGELTTIRINHKFDKETLYPISYALEAESINENGDLTLYKNSDVYKEVNAVEEIPIPDEVKALLEE